MTTQLQLSLFNDASSTLDERKHARSGTFVDNMKLPIHRWFRYSAGFSAQWVEQLLRDWELDHCHYVLDPFAGSGTVLLACENLDVNSVGVEAHPTVARICKTKLAWSAMIEPFVELAERIHQISTTVPTDDVEHPSLIQRSFEPESLAHLESLKAAWFICDDQSPASELVWLAITAILRPCSSAGTAQWQYILPNKTKKKVLHPHLAFQQQIAMMVQDMRWMQSQVNQPRAALVNGDARSFSSELSFSQNNSVNFAQEDHSHSQAKLCAVPKIDAVITSPPYANNYDYADALRFEMTFWGEVQSWGDIHDKVRKHLIVSSSQHSSKEKLDAEILLADPLVQPIRDELKEVVHELAIVRENHGGKKHYHTMIAAYCSDIAQVMQELRKVCNTGARMCWVIGDSAPYGVYCPIDTWLGELALAAGFRHYQFEKLRDRNTKWKNRKHRVPLKEGLLWIDG